MISWSSKNWGPTCTESNLHNRYIQQEPEQKILFVVLWLQFQTDVFEILVTSLVLSKAEFLFYLIAPKHRVSTYKCLAFFGPRQVSLAAAIFVLRTMVIEDFAVAIPPITAGPQPSTDEGNNNEEIRATIMKDNNGIFKHMSYFKAIESKMQASARVLEAFWNKADLFHTKF